MSRLIRALLVGIDSYQAPVPALEGCVADIEAIERLLITRAAAAGDELSVRKLVDAEAKRHAVIEAFRDHLGAAAPDDAVLFYYSGHGSQEAALPEQAELEPDGLNETLVLYDSRDPGVYDLADKELAQLVAEASGTGAHVAVVLDCCHSGSGVRAIGEEGTAIRRAPGDQRLRPLDQYMQLARGSIAAPATESAADWLNLAAARYVLFAACRSDQTAKEVRVAGSPRGAMSLALERALARSAGPSTYQDLAAWVAAGVRNLTNDQTPVLESPVPGDARQPFLGGGAAPAEPALTASFTRDGLWLLDAGLIHGIPAPAPGEPATSVSLHDWTGDGPAVATATVASVRAASSYLDVPADVQLDRAATYRAVVEILPVSRLGVWVSGDDDDLVSALTAGLAASVLVRPVADGEAPLHAVADAAGIRLTRRGGERVLVAVEEPTQSGVARLGRAVEHVARWQLLVDRTNPATSLGSDAFDLACFDESGNELQSPIERWYPEPGNRHRQPTIKIRFRNRSERRLFFALLSLGELYGVAALLPGPGQWLGPGEEAWAMGQDGRPVLYLDVPPGQERATDILKLFVASEEFDAHQLDQEPLTPPSRERGSTLEAVKGISTSPHVPAASEWATAELVVTTVLPQERRRVGPQPVMLAPRTVVQAHGALTAGARLTSQPTASRDALVPLLPPLFRDDPGVSEPFAFAPARAAGDEVAVLELSDISGAEGVTPDDPLVITVGTELGDDEYVLPVAFDGTDYLPLGSSRVAAGGGTELRLVRLPTVTDELTRSLGGSLKIMFRKLALRRVGFGYDYPRLSVVTFGEGDEPRYESDPEHVAAAIAPTTRLLVVIHGIIGDTRGMAAAVGSSGIGARYDALLAFDYENINTSIEETAGDLVGRLKRVGITADDGRHVDLVAHSMGGLVARWLVEQRGGGAVVDRVVTCGTPNAGSPWPRVEDLATAGLGLALNSLAGLGGPTAVVAKAVGFLVKSLEKVDVALDELEPGSRLLTTLAGSAQPDVSYVALGGDHPFGEDGDGARARRILEKLRVPGAALAFIFARIPNDVAVSVPSATTFGSAWSSQPPAVRVACNHLTYFASPAGIAAVDDALSSSS